MPSLTLLIDRIDTPVGEMIVLADETGALRGIDWTETEARFRQLLRRQYPGGVTLAEARNPGGHASTMQRYFAGEVGVIDDITTATGGTEFQRRVWRALRDIPAGETISYSELARRVGNAAAIRAVGLANGQNPVSVVTPCHRVIGANGSLTGYGGGLDRKRWLLAHERKYVEAAA